MRDPYIRVAHPLAPGRAVADGGARYRSGVPPATPDVVELLAAAVRDIGGAERPGQVAMAEAVRHAIETSEHLAVQAGTGTGKSLAYLVPAVRHAVTTGSHIVVATATIALQNQLIDRDLPRLTAALTPVLEREPSFAILRGRRNYLCPNRHQGGVAHDLGARVTSATTGELSGPAADAAARRAGRLTESAADVGAAPAVADQLRHAAAALVIDLGDAPAGRMDVLPETLAATLAQVRDAAGACADAVRASASSQDEDQQRLATTRLTVASLDDLQSTAGRILDAFE